MTGIARPLRVFAVTVVAALSTIASVQAEDALRLGVGGRGNWDTAPAILGQKAGIFKKHGLSLDILFTAGGGETIQVAISGAVDIGVAVGTGAALAAFAKGAPVRIIGSVTTGSRDVYYYVRTASPLKSLKDATDKTTVAYSTTGSSTNVFALGLIKAYGVPAKVSRTGDPQSTLTQVMSGQIDVGYATAPFALNKVEAGELRIIANASEAPGTQEQTARVLLANASKLEKDRAVIARFMQAYSEVVDWMYSDPAALTAYREYSGIAETIAKRTMADFLSKDMLDPYSIGGLDAVMNDAIAMKLLQAPLTKAQLDEAIQVPARAK